MNNESEKDIDFEFEDSEASSADKLKFQREKLKICVTEKQEYLTNWQKERADFQNFKKDEEKRIIDRANFLKEKFAGDFLTALDSFDMAMQNKEAWEKVDKNWRTGVEYIYNQFLAALQKNGIEPVGEVGVLFDSSVHQSVETEPTTTKEDDHKVSAIIQKGFKMGAHLIRPARVKVFEYKGE